MTRFVANFVGAANVLDGAAARQLTGQSSAMLRPERIRLGAAGGAVASGTVREVQYFGAFTRIKVEAAGVLLQADLPLAAGAVGPAGGDRVHLHWDRGAVHALGAG
jgi:putative spermidine/putrescine transport system ATP-binding protein